MPTITNSTAIKTRHSITRRPSQRPPQAPGVREEEAVFRDFQYQHLFRVLALAEHAVSTRVNCTHWRRLLTISRSESKIMQSHVKKAKSVELMAFVIK